MFQEELAKDSSIFIVQRGNLFNSQSPKSDFQAQKLEFGGQTQAHRFDEPVEGTRHSFFSALARCFILSSPVTVQRAPDSWDEEWELHGNRIFAF